MNAIKKTTKSGKAVYTLVVGLGKTGLSVVRYLRALGETVIVVDSRDQPPALLAFKNEFSDVECVTGKFKKKLFVKAHRIIVSPGVALTEPVLLKARSKNIEITGDIDLFAHAVRAPVIGITGSNGKSTVTTLVALMAAQAGVNVLAAGNIGLPALDALNDNVDLYVLELSSFQLDSMQYLPMKAAVVLNLSADHLDRYENLSAYAQSKQAIYKNAGIWVLNKDDALACQVAATGENQIRFTMNTPQENEFGLSIGDGDREYLCFGAQQLIAVDQLKVKGLHNIQNALAALALGMAAGLSVDSMCNTLREFTGLAHRTQFVAEINGVNWINDSKATNVGATMAALVGLPGRHVLIAGGDAKNADFSELAAVVKQHCRAVVLIGKDALKIKAALPATVPVVMVADLPGEVQDLAKSQDGETMMSAAVRAAQSLAEKGDNVLLAPACASIDMFDNFEHRGDVFIASVKMLQSEAVS